MTSGQLANLDITRMTLLLGGCFDFLRLESLSWLVPTLGIHQNMGYAKMYKLPQQNIAQLDLDSLDTRGMQGTSLISASFIEKQLEQGN